MPLVQPLPPAFRTPAFAVSHETLERLQLFAELLLRWNRRINLVAPTDLPELWERHVLDSLQLLPLLPPDAHTALDIGSGAGFPGLVLTIASGIPTMLVEADQRKAAFLREGVRLTGAAATVVVRRVETLSVRVDLITARAVAQLPQLLAWAEPRLSPGGHCLFQKGRGAEAEIAMAAEAWRMQVESFASLTASTGSILRIGRIEPR